MHSKLLVSKSSIIGYLFVITIFTKLSSIYLPGLGDYDVYAYSVLSLFFLFYPCNTRVFLNVIIVFFIILIVNLCVKFILDYKITPFIKQLIPAFVIYSAAFIYMINKKATKLFQFYLNCSLILSLIGLFQFTIFFIGINISNHSRFIIKIQGFEFMRISSFLPEPSHLALVILPAAIYCTIVYGFYNLKTLLILTVIILTFSLTSFAALLAIALIHYFTGRLGFKIIPYLFILPIIAYGGYQLIDPIKYRVDETIKYLDIKNFNNTTNTSTYSLITNLNVAAYSLKKALFLEWD